MTTVITNNMSNETFPTQITVDMCKESRSVMLTPQIEAAIPDTTEAFSKLDKAFLRDPERYLEELDEACFTFKSGTGVDIACSLLYDDSSKKDEILMIWAPFSDGAPQTGGDEIYRYITEPLPGGPKGLRARGKAKPGTWNQTTKSAVIQELLGALGTGMPVLTIYSPIPTKAYYKVERKLFKKEGNFSPASRVALEALAEAQRRLHGAYSETKIDKVNLHGASLGASNAIGSAKGLMSRDIAVPSITAQELIMGPVSLTDVAKKFTIATRVGEASDADIPENTRRIYEPAIRRRIDAHGSELAMYTRLLKAAKPTYLRGLARPGETMHTVETLLDDNVSILVALAENSGLTQSTAKFLPKDKEKLIKVRAENGQFADHLIDEHVALTALIAALGLKKEKSSSNAHN